MLIIILILLKQWINIPNWAIWVFISLSLIIDVIMFPFVWRAYDKGDQNNMSGSQGVAVDQLSPSGYVRINGELWQAKVFEGNSTIEKGEVVMVKSINGLTLFVQSDKKEKT